MALNDTGTEEQQQQMSKYLTPSDKNGLYEMGMKEQAIERLEKNQRLAVASERESTVHPFNSMTAHMMNLMEQEIRKQMRKRGRGRPPIGYQELKSTKLKPDMLAGITARTIVDGVSKSHRLQKINERVGRRVEDEIRMREFKRREPKLWQWMQQKFKDQASEDYRHKRQVLMAAMRRANSEEVRAAWTTKECASVGTILVNTALSTGFVQLAVQYRKRGDNAYPVYFLELSDDAREALSQADARAHELLQPWFKPMLIPPVDWTDPENGGYIQHDLPIMKTWRRQDIERLRHADMPIVYQALNSIQRTPWRINTDVLVVAEEGRRLEWDLKGLPIVEEQEEPVRPDLPPKGAALDDEQMAVLGRYKREKRAFHEGQSRRSSRTTLSLQIFAVADELRHEDRFFFPHQIDYRGRAYAIPLQLNPQGNDLSKGLLTFAEERPLGEMGLYWLAVHGANCWGNDKGKLNDRVQWVEDHELDILDVAADPLVHRWWQQAESPWQFLAFCVEWGKVGGVDAPPEAMSSLPVSVDGSCNGLQHFSAMLRDTVGAQVTNLCPADEQQDIYGIVAAKVLDKIRAKQHESAIDRELAGLWLEFGVARGVVKRAVMTTPYGVSKHGMQKQLMSDVINTEAPAAFGDNPGRAAWWLTTLIHEAISETVSSASEAMKFIQDLTRLVVKAKQALAWTTPAGLPVVQQIFSTTTFTLSTTMLGSIRKLGYSSDTPKLDAKKMVNASAPNIVHSLDASHLMLTVSAMEDQLGPGSWAMVHDSYGTHAGLVEEMGRVLREEFVALYEDQNPLDDLRHFVLSIVPDGTEVPLAPIPGDFDLELVKKADFFFA